MQIQQAHVSKQRYPDIGGAAVLTQLPPRQSAIRAHRATKTVSGSKASAEGRNKEQRNSDPQLLTLLPKPFYLMASRTCKNGWGCNLTLKSGPWNVQDLFPKGSKGYQGPCERRKWHTEDTSDSKTGGQGGDALKLCSLTNWERERSVSSNDCCLVH